MLTEPDTIASHSAHQWLKRTLSPCLYEMASHVHSWFERRYVPQDASVQVITDHANGCGFLIHPNGWLLTAYHVVSGATTAWVVLANGAVVSGRVGPTDPSRDCALIRLDAGGRYPFMGLADPRTLRAGQAACVIGREPLSASWFQLPRDETPTLRVAALAATIVPMNLAFVAAPLANDSFEILALTSSSMARPGYSGAPICCPRSGHVLGLFAWTNAQRSNAFGVPVRVLIDFLREQGFPIFRQGRSYQLPVPKGTENRLLSLHLYGALSHYPEIQAPERLQSWPQLETVMEAANDIVTGFADYAAGWALRGWLRWAQGDKIGAQSDARRALTCGVSPSAWFLLHRLSVQDEAWEEAAEYARQGLETLPPWDNESKTSAFRRQGLACRAEALAAAGRVAEAITMCEAEQTPDARLSLVWARCLQTLGQPDEALTVLRRALNDEPVQDDEPIHPELVGALMEALVEAGTDGHFREAICLGFALPARMVALPARFYSTLGQAWEGLGWTQRGHELMALDGIPILPPPVRNRPRHRIVSAPMIPGIAA